MFLLKMLNGISNGSRQLICGIWDSKVMVSLLQMLTLVSNSTILFSMPNIEAILRANSQLMNTTGSTQSRSQSLDHQAHVDMMLNNRAMIKDMVPIVWEQSVVAVLL